MPGGYRIYLPRRQTECSSDFDEREAAPVFIHPAMTIWSDEPIILLGEKGCLIGHLFTREQPSKRVEQFKPEEIEKIVESGGRSILRDYWGGYVLAIISSEGVPTILRDPSAMLPCYFRRDIDAVRLADDITVLAKRGASSVDELEIARYLASGDAPGRATSVFGIETLFAGESLTLAQARVTIETWWSPWTFVGSTEIVSFDESAARLRMVLLDCIRAWANCFPDILLGVSGGLDSSIVAAGMAGHRHFRCYTSVGPDADGDERRYARALTDALAVPLREEHYDVADIDVTRAVAPHHPWPNALFYRQAIEAMHRRISEDHPIGAYFSGNGGDAVFCSMRSATPLVDRFLAEGLRRSLTGTLRDLCDVTGADGRTVLRYAWNKYRGLKDGHMPKLNFLGLRSNWLVRIEAGGFRHPWLSMSSDALPGKRTHVAFLTRAQRSLELYPRRRAAPHIAPLLSQPVVELCLSIPTWTWIAGGRNRALARAAVQGLLPDLILRRTHKGGPSGFGHMIFREKKAELCTLLRNGRLAEMGIIDTTILDEAEDAGLRGTERSDRILSLAVAENWVRWWSGG